MNLARGILVTGTDTGVGKTVVTCRLLEQLRSAGMKVVGMKPVASGLIEKNGRWISEDVEAISHAMERDMDRQMINPYAFKPFIAPHLAAKAIGVSIELERIEACYRQLAEQANYVVVEGAGGLMTPLNTHETFVDLANRLELSVLLVVAIRLGCINHALLTAKVIETAGLPFIGWVANYPDRTGERNIGVETTIKSHLAAPLIGVISYGAQASENSAIDLARIIHEGFHRIGS